jgi:hypothetical protein
MINAYKQQLTYYFNNPVSEMERLLLDGQRTMMKLFFTVEEIQRIENEMRVNENKIIIEYMENIESWTKTIEGKKIYFEWNFKGLDFIESYLDYTEGTEEYRKFKLALQLTRDLLEKKAA